MAADGGEGEKAGDSCRATAAAAKAHVMGRGPGIGRAGMVWRNVLEECIVGKMNRTCYGAALLVFGHPAAMASSLVTGP